MSSTRVPRAVTDEHRDQFRREGYFILDGVLTTSELEVLRDGADYAIAKLDARMDAAGVDVLGINHRGKRYFSAMTSRERTDLRAFVFGDLMAEICRATIGDTAYFFLEQYVVKASDPDTAFAWHQDSGYVHEDHRPYLTCWMALDDITERNGPVFLMPFSRSGIRSYVKHVKDDRRGDRICYFGDDPGVPMIVPAGSIAVFSSVVIHRSGPNLTDQQRRAFIAQYSPEVIRKKDGSGPWAGFEPFLTAGRVVAP
jgi:ectoine hydroxylase-related dioxygenase (phytanoyl-CoA dioxygenase family)